MPSSSSVAEPFDDEAVAGVNAHRDEPIVTDRDKAVWRLGPDNDDVAGTRNNLFPIDGHCRFAGLDNARLGIRMLMQSRTSPGLKVPNEKRDAGTVWLAFELNSGDCASPLIAAMQDVEHSPSSQYQRVNSAVATIFASPAAGLTDLAVFDRLEAGSREMAPIAVP